MKSVKYIEREMGRVDKIAIVNSSSFGKIFPNHLERLKKIGEVTHFRVNPNIDGKDLANKLTGYNYIIASVTPNFSKEFFLHKDDLKIISRHGIGYNNIDLDAAKQKGTIVSIVSPLVERDAVAENNITNLLNVMRKTHPSFKSILNNKWEDRASFVGHRLSNKTVGLVGIGNIGSRVSEILYYGFKCSVLAYDPNKNKDYIEQFGAKKVSFDYLLENSDVICICASLNTNNYHMFNREEFSKMKENVYISNTARGELINEVAMIEALENGIIAGFATDVLENEPGRSDHKYLNYNNVLITPHTSAYIKECLEGMGEKCVQDCEAIANNCLPETVVQDETTHI